MTRKKMNRTRWAALALVPLLALGLMVAMPALKVGATTPPDTNDQGEGTPGGGDDTPVDDGNDDPTGDGNNDPVGGGNTDPAEEPPAPAATEVLTPEEQGIIDREVYDERHDEYWHDELAVFSQATPGSAIELDCSGMDYLPFYILNFLNSTDDTARLEWNGYLFNISGAGLGKLNPDLNYRFEDLLNMGLGTKIQ